MAMFRLTAIVFFIFGLSGCADLRDAGSSPYIQGNLTVFHGESAERRGNIMILPIDNVQQDSLQFRAIADYIAKKLVANGYAQVSSPGDSEYFAYVTYGIDNGKATYTSVPLYGQTGGGTTYSSGTLNGVKGMTTYNGYTTTMPTYGVVGQIPVDITTFKRDINIDVYRKKYSQKPEKVYEIRASSSGSCGNINAVIYPIIDGIFNGFPGVSGQSSLMKVPFNGKC